MICHACNKFRSLWRYILHYLFFCHLLWHHLHEALNTCIPYINRKTKVCFQSSSNTGDKSPLQRLWFMSTHYIVINVQKPIMLKYIKPVVYHSVVINHSRCDSSWLLLSWLIITLSTLLGTLNIVLQFNHNGTSEQTVKTMRQHSVQSGLLYWSIRWKG